MADSEFEELDKAVASVLSTDVPKAEEPVAVEEPVTAKDDAVVVEATRAKVILRPKNSGRFMDVVHPSSDMRPGQSTEDKTADPTKPATEVEPDTTTMPDPLDFNKFNLNDTPKVIEPDAAEEPAKVPVDEPKADEPTESLTTPFLADAKVEKRPLGAFSDTVIDEESKPAESKVDEATQDEEEASLPAELHTDLLTIEASEPATFIQPAEEDTPVPSIVQQYQEKPNSDTKPTAAIYDTESYQTPLKYPVKKKRGWVVILWILGFIIVGGAIGAALYFFVLPKLV